MCGGGSQKKKKVKVGRLKITVVGDGMVGKTCLLVTYVENKFPDEYVPTVFENHFHTINIDDQVYDVTLWDTAGQEDYERLRPLSYPHTDCFLVCYSVNNPSSYENVLSKWYPELQHLCPKVPIILVATKTDLRAKSKTDIIDSNQNEPTEDKKVSERSTKKVHFVTPKQGKKMRRKIHADKFIECSALQKENLDVIFVAAVKSALKKYEDSRCTIS